MTTQTIRADQLPQGWSFPSFGRIVSIVSHVLDAYAEALQQAEEARKRYPFASVE